MKDKGKQAKQGDITGRILYLVATAIALFGIVQFLVVALLTLFGVKLGWLQYIASIVLFATGILIVIFGGGEDE